MRPRWWLIAGLVVLAFASWFSADSAVWARSKSAQESKEERPESSVRAGRMSCEDIVHTADRLPQPADPVRVGRVLGQEFTWVERCLVTYGRRLRRSAPIHEEVREEEQEASEDAEPEEVGAEEERDARTNPHRQQSERRPRKTPTPEVPDDNPDPNAY